MDRQMSETGKGTWGTGLAINQDEFSYHHHPSFAHRTAREEDHIHEAEEQRSERGTQGNKSYPSLSRQLIMHAEEPASDYCNRPYQQDRRMQYASSAYHHVVEGDGQGDSRDEVVVDKHRQQQIQDRPMYMNPGQVHMDHFQYPEAYHLQHETNYAGYYYHHDMGVPPYWHYGGQGPYAAPPQHSSNAHLTLGESPEEGQNYRHMVKSAHRTMIGTSVSRTAPLFMICDTESLSEYQCLIRKQIELFSATDSDIELTVQGRNRHIEAGQVGVRCRHCADMPIKKRARGAVYYPSKLSCIYQAAQNMASVHLTKHCTRVPSYIRTELLKKDRKSSAGSGKEYWAVGARTSGVVEIDGRLWFGDNVPVTRHRYNHFGNQC